MRFIVFDTETNGLRRDNSVLSISAVKASYDGRRVTLDEWFNRFYFRKPDERENSAAVECNGLTEVVIRKKRGAAAYPLYFHEDTQSFKRFFRGVHHFVGHNIAFDCRFIPFTLKHTFCTMSGNQKIVCALNKKGGIKRPNLDETAEFYKIRIDENKRHESQYDVELTLAVFKKMLKRKASASMLVEWLDKK
jgi:DNA polymerase III epsilon subunit-like protein